MAQVTPRHTQEDGKSTEDANMTVRGPDTGTCLNLSGSSGDKNYSKEAAGPRTSTELGLPALPSVRRYLSQPVPQSLDHDAAVVVALLLVGPAELLHPEAGDGEQAQVVTDAGVQRRDEVREAVVGVRAGGVLLGLKTKQRPDGRSARDGSLVFPDGPQLHCYIPALTRGPDAE